MSYLILLIFLLVFALGYEKSKELSETFSSLQMRQALLKRALGFVVMSAWIHSLPYILMTIYMREMNLGSVEVFGHDEAMTYVVTAYLVRNPLLYVLALTLGGVFVYRLNIKESAEGSEDSNKMAKSSYFMAFSIVLIFLLGPLAAEIIKGGAKLAFTGFLVGISAPVSLYAILTLSTPLTMQVKAYWAPFAMVGLTTASLFGFSSVTASFVAEELQQFKLGGGSLVAVTIHEKTFIGSLALLTSETAFIDVITDSANTPECSLRLPAKDIQIAHPPRRTDLTVFLEFPNLYKPEFRAKYRENASAVCDVAGRNFVSRNHGP